jgi:hypothetical protein
VEKGSTVTTSGGIKTVVCTTVIVPGGRTLEVTFVEAGEGYIRSQKQELKQGNKQVLQKQVQEHMNAEVARLGQCRVQIMQLNETWSTDSD